SLCSVPRARARRTHSARPGRRACRSAWGRSVARPVPEGDSVLEVAALANGRVINVSAIARDAAVARPTVQGYFDILVDTLVGVWLPAWRPRAKVKEVAHPKFYFFDTGAVRALAGRLREPLTDQERGHLLEPYVLHELCAWSNPPGCGGQVA